MLKRNICRVGALALLSAACVPARGQLHESISVEGKYVPEVIRVDRVNTFPEAVSFSLDTTPMEYEWGGVAASFVPSLMALPATGWRDTHDFMTSPGYLEFGAGSWLNSTLSAGYRFIDNATTLAGIRLQHNSTSLWKPRMSDATADVRQYRYDESAGVYVSHVVKGYGRLDAAFDYNVGVYNYYGTFDRRMRSDRDMDVPDQTVNEFALFLDWKSSLRPGASLRYGASARVRHTGFRSLPLPVEWGMPHAKGNRETEVDLSGNVRLPWENGASIGLDADLSVLLYGGEKELDMMSPAGVAGKTLRRPDNYAVLTLTPYYRFTRGMLDLRVGADLDLAFNAGQKGNRYSFLHVAPDVRFALQTGQVGMYLNLTGGSALNTLANLRQQDYYMMPALTTTRPTYTPVDAALGINVGPFAGFSAGISARFRSSRNVRLGGWYQAWLDYDASAMPGMDAARIPASHRMEYSLNEEGINLHGYSLSASMAYEPSSSLRLRAEGSLQPQKGKKGFFNGYDRARVTARFEASVRPIDKLGITLGYDYRGVRNIYTTAVAPLSSGNPAAGGDDTSLVPLRLPDLTLLNLSASWNFTSAFSVWLQGDNLLNRHDEVLPCLPTQGIVLTAGLKILF